MGTAFIFFGRPINNDTATILMSAMRTFIGEGAPNYLWDTFQVSMSSGGGDISSAFGLYNEIRGMDVRVNTHNSGAVDSAALTVFLAGERRTASKYSGFMLHQMSWTFGSVGQTRTQIAEITDWMKTYDRMAAEIIAERTSIPAVDAAAMMRDGTNLSPEKALELGIIHAIEEPRTPRDARSWQV